MFWNNVNEKYYGNWTDNQQNEIGTHIWLEQRAESKYLRNRYQGEWKDGSRHGAGVFYYGNGAKYIGNWKNNLKDGFAIFLEENGHVVSGIF